MRVPTRTALSVSAVLLFGLAGCGWSTIDPDAETAQVAQPPANQDADPAPLNSQSVDASRDDKDGKPVQSAAQAGDADQFAAAPATPPDQATDSAIATNRDAAPATASDAQASDAHAADAQSLEARADELDRAAPTPSPLATQLAQWAATTGDNGGLPFVIVDKLGAQVSVYDAGGQLMGAAPALVGLAQGDDSVPGIGNRAMSKIRPEERTTPAGRFVGGFGFARGGGQVFWVDFEDAISMHPVVTNHPKEHRLERIASASPEDHRISYGCINVPADFYHEVVRPTFTGTKGVVYVLPDSKSVEEVFPAFAAQRAGLSPGKPSQGLLELGDPSDSHADSAASGAAAEASGSAPGQDVTTDGAATAAGDQRKSRSSKDAGVNQEQ